MVMYRIDKMGCQGGGAKNRSLGQTKISNHFGNIYFIELNF